ncbi:MAG: TVP38/TMEM64 family protein [Clostridiales bacterium]|nr:TVP38/TMEM64 family protein [Clostridiales bacterium]
MRCKKVKRYSTNKSAPIRVLIFFLLTAVCIAFSVLCLMHTRLLFLQKNQIVFIVLSVFFFCFLCGVSIWAILRTKETLVKSLISVYLFLLFCFVLLFILQQTDFFNIIKDENSLQAYLKKAGVWMPIVYIVVQYLQVVILPIPGIVSTVAGVALFGPFYTAIYSLIGILLGSFSAFFIGRKLGYKATKWLVGEETLLKWQTKLKGKDSFILTAMFLLPLFPDDILCFLAGLSSLSVRYFIVMISLTRIISIFATCYSVDFIPFNTWWGLLLWGIFFFVIILGFYLIYKNTDKLQSWYSRLLKKHKNKRNK